MSNMDPTPGFSIARARSMIPLVLTLAQTLAIAAGVDASGFVDVADQAGRALDGAQMILPLATTVWFWLERRAQRRSFP